MIAWSLFLEAASRMVVSLRLQRQQQAYYSRMLVRLLFALGSIYNFIPH